MNPALIAQLAIGGGQLLAGSAKAWMNKRPEKDIPPALRESLMLSRLMVSDPNAPGYSEGKSSIDTAAANAIMAAKMSGRAQESIGTVASGQTRGYLGLAEQNSQSQYQDLNSLRSDLQTYAQAENEQEMYNEFAPFADNAQESRDIFGAGLQNIVGGLDMGQISGAFQGGGQQVPAPDGLSSSQQLILEKYLESLRKGYVKFR